MFDYCDHVYDNLSMYNINELQKIQNRAMRMIPKKDIYTPVTELHYNLEMDRLEERRNKHTARVSTGLVRPCRLTRALGNLLTALRKYLAVIHSNRAWFPSKCTLKWWINRPLSLKNCTDGSLLAYITVIGGDRGRGATQVMKGKSTKACHFVSQSNCLLLTPDCN